MFHTHATSRVVHARRQAGSLVYIIYCSSNVYKLISFFIGLPLVAGLCSLDVGWEIVVQTHAETGVSLNKLSSSITAFINIIGVGFQTTFSVKYILEARSDYCSSPEQTGRGFAFTLAKSTRIFCGPFERYVRDKHDCNTRPLLTKR